MSQENSTETTLNVGNPRRGVPQVDTAGSLMASFANMSLEHMAPTPDYDGRRFDARSMQFMAPRMAMPGSVILSPMDISAYTTRPSRVGSPEMYDGRFDGLEHFVYQAPVYMAQRMPYQEYSRDVCRFHVQGSCHKGDRCRFSHQPTYTQPSISPGAMSGHTMYASSPESTPNSAHTNASRESGYKRTSPSSEASRKSQTRFAEEGWCSK
jgi:hypothetical protein